MHLPEILSEYNMQSVQEPDGYYMTSEIDFNKENFRKLISEFNNIVEILQVVLANSRITMDED